jgi:glutamine amidotransferase
MKIKQNIVLIDYCQGNLRSIFRRITRAGYSVVISNDPSEIEHADKIILPGVGHFYRAMQYLKEYNLVESLNEAVLNRKTPVLGICLGMQLLTNQSEEGNASGLGWINAEVKKFTINDTIRYKVPHMGWNDIKVIRNSEILRNIGNSNSFYFAHSYHLVCTNVEDITSQTTYEYTFPSSIQRNNIFGTQFHPEKSHENGENILKNFLML